MDFLARAALLATTLLGAVHSQFVSAPTDLISTKGFLDIPVRYKEVPEGICELTPGVKSYSGYVDISPHQHLFFWFFEARNQDPASAPLTVWINGGPGSPSMIGLFQENGPCGVDSNTELYYNPYSWNNASNMLYIDQPAQTGFSYSTPVPGYLGLLDTDFIQLPTSDCPGWADGCATYTQNNAIDTVNSTIGGAPGMWRALQGFMGAFPTYSRSSFHFTTESYGGHYGPVYNEYIESQNALIRSGNVTGAKEINLQSVLIGNGWFDPLIQYGAYYNYSVSPGNTYDVTMPHRAQQKMYNAMYGPGNCADQIKQCYQTGRDDVCSAADNFCYNEVEDLYDTVLGRDEYDVRELTPDPFPYEFYVDYLNLPHVQKAVGAFVNFTDTLDGDVTATFGTTGDDARTEGTIVAVRKLVEQGVYVMQYNGDADYICNWLGNQAVVEEINPPGMSTAGFVDVETSDGISHGQVKQSANFAFVRVYESGHEVPFYQPVIALEMLERALAGKDIATGKTAVSKGSSYKTSGPPQSTYRQGNSTVQYKVLKADATYNTTTNEPNPPAAGHGKRSIRSASGKKRRRSGSKVSHRW